MRDLRRTRDFVRIQGDDGSVPHLCTEEEVGEEGEGKLVEWCSSADVCVNQGAFHTMELPETIRKRLEDFSRNVLFDQSRTQPFTKENDTFLPHGKPSQHCGHISFDDNDAN